RGYDVQEDLSFEKATENSERYSKGYIDILVVDPKTDKPRFLVEAKRQSKPLTAKDQRQALEYGKSIDVPFVVVTNGADLQLFNGPPGAGIKWNGKLDAHVPTKANLPIVLKAFKAKPELNEFELDNATQLPFRPGLPLKQLNKLFAQCHKIIRN